MKYDPEKVLLTLDLAGTLVFSIEGAEAAIFGHLDFFGVVVLGFTTALGGGIIRDVLIGAVPPGALRDWRYSVVAFGGGVLAFFLHDIVQVIPAAVMVALDAAGLALFAVAGAEKALVYKMHPFIAVLMGGITGVGGGTIRDIFLAQVPTVLRADIYATAALAGAAVLILTRRLGLSRGVTALLGGMVCFGLRVISVWQHWQLPKVSS